MPIFLVICDTDIRNEQHASYYMYLINSELELCKVKKRQAELITDTTANVRIVRQNLPR
jgi:hypothetical protein